MNRSNFLLQIKCIILLKHFRRVNSAYTYLTKAFVLQKFKFVLYCQVCINIVTSEEGSGKNQLNQWKCRKFAKKQANLLFTSPWSKCALSWTVTNSWSHVCFSSLSLKSGVQIYLFQILTTSDITQPWKGKSWIIWGITRKDKFTTKIPSVGFGSGS